MKSAPISSRYITLTHKDPEFESYLLGTFSQSQRAIPIESFGVNTPRERVTFKVVDKSELEAPHPLVILVQSWRPSLLTFTLSPALVTFCYLWTQGQILYPWLILNGLLVLLCFHGAAFLLNDYFDHYKGWDRMSQKRGSQVIQKGWMTAHSLWRWGVASLIIGGVVGLPILWTHPQQLGVLALVVGVALPSFSGRHWSLKSAGLGDVFLFLCLGPLLTYGCAVTISGQSSFFILYLGLIYGLLSLVTYQVRQLERLFLEVRGSSGTLLSRLGFDRSKVLIFSEITCVGLLLMGLYWVGKWGAWIFLLIGVLLVCGWPILLKLKKASSPLSSELIAVGRKTVGYHFLFSVIIFFSVWAQWKL